MKMKTTMLPALACVAMLVACSESDRQRNDASALCGQDDNCESGMGEDSPLEPPGEPGELGPGSDAPGAEQPVALRCAAPPPGPANEEIIHVATNGSDGYSCAEAANPGTPKATIGAALDCISFDAGAGANKAVEIAGGAYDESLLRGNSFPKGSSWNAPFTLRAKPREKVVIRATSGGHSFLVNDEESGIPFYAVIQGITFDGSNAGNPTVGIFAQYVRMVCNELVNIENGNGLMGGRPNFEFISNKIHGGRFCVSPDCVDGGGGHYAYPLYWGASNAIFDGNEFYDFPSFGYHIYSGYGCPSNVEVRNNWVHDFGWAANCPGPDPRCAGRGHDDRGVAILACGTDHEVYDNVVFNGTAGINAYTGSGKHILNNTIYNMSISGIVSNDSDGNVVKDNIVYNPMPPRDGDIFSYQDPDTTTYGTNLCAQPGTGCSVVGDPLFVDAANGNFKLQPGSPAAGLGASL